MPGNNLPQSPPYISIFGVAEECCMLSLLLAVPSCFNSFCHPYIQLDFYTCNITTIYTPEEQRAPRISNTHENTKHAIHVSQYQYE